MKAPTFHSTTHDIRVSVQPVHLDDPKEYNGQQYVWAYMVEIENMGGMPVKLMNRRWHITDGNGQVQEVEGPGVVGVQPELQPGESYRYSSGTALLTPSGLMQGQYEMRTPEGESFWVDIPAFSLDSPDQLKRPN